jgi:hypothetical protein
MNSSDNMGKVGGHVRGESCKKDGKRKRSKANRRKAKAAVGKAAWNA